MSGKEGRMVQLVEPGGHFILRSMNIMNGVILADWLRRYPIIRRWNKSFATPVQCYLIWLC